MPLARAAMHARHETVHVAQWPWVKDMHQVACRHYAFEGRCFVLASGSLLTRGDILEGFASVANSYPHAEELLQSIVGDDDRMLMRAGSGVVWPDGAWVVEPHGPELEPRWYRERGWFDYFAGWARCQRFVGRWSTR